MADTPANGPELIGVLDMGASAIRLVVAEIDAKRSVSVIEEASRMLAIRGRIQKDALENSGRRG